LKNKIDAENNTTEKADGNQVIKLEKSPPMSGSLESL